MTLCSWQVSLVCKSVFGGSSTVALGSSIYVYTPEIPPIQCVCVLMRLIACVFL